MPSQSHTVIRACSHVPRRNVGVGIDRHRARVGGERLVVAVQRPQGIRAVDPRVDIRRRRARSRGRGSRSPRRGARGAKGDTPRLCQACANAGRRASAAIVALPPPRRRGSARAARCRGCSACPHWRRRTRARGRSRPRPPPRRRLRARDPRESEGRRRAGHASAHRRDPSPRRATACRWRRRGGRARPRPRLPGATPAGTTGRLRARSRHISVGARRNRPPAPRRTRVVSLAAASLNARLCGTASSAPADTSRGARPAPARGSTARTAA